MITLLETPIPIILFGIFALAVLGLILLRTGRGVLLGVIIGVAVLVAAGVGLERMVVTERERIETMLEAAAVAIAANDKQAVLQCVDPSNGKTRRLIDMAFGNVEFTKAKITRLEISFKELASPPRATARITVRVSFDLRNGTNPYETYPASFSIELCRTGDKWLVADHDWKNDPYNR